jgi:hypothetical protein
MKTEELLEQILGPERAMDFLEWVRLTPAERYRETIRLWDHYLSLGGTLDPESDSQSPFDFPELERAFSADRRPSLYPVWGGRIQPGSGPGHRDGAG